MFLFKSFKKVRKVTILFTIDEVRLTIFDLDNGQRTMNKKANRLKTYLQDVVSADIIETNSMSGYPNTNNGMFSIGFSNIEGDATYQLINVRGAVVETRDITVMDGETMNFNYNLRAGAYFVRIISADKVYIEQIVIE